MPIKFRCQHCRQFLGISRQKAGALTDCPTCGQTIRVPDLNGELEPLPESPAPRDAEPEVKLSPEELEKASAETIGVEAELPSPESRQLPPAAPIVQSPFDIEIEIPTDRMPAPRAAAAAHKPATPSPRPPRAAPHDVFTQLQNVPERPATARRMRKNAGLFSPLVLLTACLVCFLAGLIIGWTLGQTGNSKQPTREAQREAPPGNLLAQNPPENPPAADEAPAAPPVVRPPPPPPAGEFGLTGTVRYESMSGASLADEGARVLAIPVSRASGGKLPAAGFRIGAANNESGTLEVSTIAAGGGFTRVDRDGNLSLHVPAAGRYAVLIVSRFQTRPATSPVSNSVREFLDQTFDRPGQVLGSLQFDYREVTLAAGVPEDLKIYFVRE